MVTLAAYIDTLTPDPAQQQRTERAWQGLTGGLFTVQRIGPSQWSVKNGDKLPYAVELNDGLWSCTCPDFQKVGPEIRCKHVEAVRIAETQQTYPTPTLQENTTMLTTPSNDFEHILTELCQPLDMARVKRRQAPGSGTVPYLEGYDVIDTANRIFAFRWSFNLLSEPQITRWNRKVLVWDGQQRKKVPVLDAQGTPQTEEVGIIHITGSVAVNLDGQTYTHSDLGRCIFTGDSPEALDMALACCVTDCLKRCFRQLGEQFGLSLYDKEIAATAGTSNGSGNTGASSSTDRSAKSDRTPAASNKAQPAAERAYLDGTKVNGNESERSAFDSFLKAKGQAPKSRDALREWMRTAQPTAA
jgi:predicted nucleic acid-binding Zn finger protein